MHRSLQRQYGHIEAVRLWCEFEIRMHVDFAHAERVRRQRLDCRIDYVVAECHVHLTRTGARHTVAGGDHVPTADQRTAAPGKQRPNVL